MSDSKNKIKLFEEQQVLLKGVSALDAPQKEKYIYDRREWAPIYDIVSYICVMLFVFLMTAWRDDMTTGDARFAVGFIVVVGVLPSLWRSSLRITVMDSKVTFMQGFLFGDWAISYDDVASIIFINSSKFDYGEKSWSFKQREFGFAHRDLQFVIKLNNGDYYIIRSKHAKEVLAAIKKARPSIIIS